MDKSVCLVLLLAAAAFGEAKPAGWRGPREPLFHPKRNTPDGQTPSEETFCTDYYKGVSGRLYGLCNSYCEAMDCDSATPKVVDAACYSVGHLLANVAGDAFNLDPELINPNDTCKDTDVDGHPDFLDNCPFVYNPDQANSDTDSFGDACDNCKFVANEDQANSDTDTFGDACDNCKFVDNEDQANSDTDTFGDACDNCILVANEDQADSNGNGVGDACEEACGCVDTWTNNIGNDPLVSPLVGYQCWVVGQPTPPYNFLEAELVCYNNALDAGYEADTEVTDGKCIDYKPGNSERNRNVPFPTAQDTEACWDYLLEQGGNPDADTDGDYVPDSLDNCPNVPNFDQTDTDGDGVGDACETAECPCAGLYANYTDFWTTGFGVVTSACSNVITPGTPETYDATFEGSDPATRSFIMNFATAAGPPNTCSASFRVNLSVRAGGETGLSDEEVALCNDLIAQAQTDLCP